MRGEHRQRRGDRATPTNPLASRQPLARAILEVPGAAVLMGRVAPVGCIMRSGHSGDPLQGTKGTTVSVI